MIACWIGWICYVELYFNWFGFEDSCLYTLVISLNCEFVQVVSAYCHMLWKIINLLNAFQYLKIHYLEFNIEIYLLNFLIISRTNHPRVIHKTWILVIRLPTHKIPRSIDWIVLIRLVKGKLFDKKVMETAFYQVEASEIFDEDISVNCC